MLNAGDTYQMNDIPIDVLARVFTHLEPQDTVEAGKTCKAWRAASHDAKVWRNYAQNTFGASPDSIDNPRQWFRERLSNSAAVAQSLQQARCRPRTVEKLADVVAPLAAVHRLRVAHAILDDLSDAMTMRLDLDAVTNRVACALSCSPEPEVAARADALMTQVEQRILPSQQDAKLIVTQLRERIASCTR